MTLKLVIRESESPRPTAWSILISRMFRGHYPILKLFVLKLFLFGVFVQLLSLGITVNILARQMEFMPYQYKVCVLYINNPPKRKKLI